MARNSVISSSSRILSMALCCGLLLLASLHMVTATSRPVLEVEDRDADLVKRVWRPALKCERICETSRQGVFTGYLSRVTCVANAATLNHDQCSYFCTKECDMTFEDYTSENNIAECKCKRKKTSPKSTFTQ